MILNPVDNPEFDALAAEPKYEKSHQGSFVTAQTGLYVPFWI